MSACPIKDLNLKDLQTHTEAVQGVRIINRSLFDKLVNDQKAFDEVAYGKMNLGDPFIVTKKTDTNPNNTRETRLSNNTYTETYQANELYYKELQNRADIKANFDLFAEDRERLYEDELGQDPSLDDARALKDLEYLISTEKVEQLCKLG